MALADSTRGLPNGGGGGGDNGSLSSSAEPLLFPDIVQLNVRVRVYVTRSCMVVLVPDSLLWRMFTQQQPQELARDSKGHFFLDRDGFLFRYILDYVLDLQLVLPDYFPERSRLQREAEYFELPELLRRLGAPQQPGQGPPPPPSRRRPEQQEGASAGAPSPALELASRSPSGGAAGPLLTVSQSLNGSRRSGYITIGYRGSYTIGRNAQADAKFRRVARTTRYTSRYYLKFNFLEQAFDKLSELGFHTVACSSTGTCTFASSTDQSEDKIWPSYSEYVFCRE
ncbi:BTB/POZ domain-containing protein kctd12 [Saguinus oedipus]|uniref:BTB/POZ domain-containing protein kctd12 n=1 Tax=Saguinus oedipus TaxID=9490 RepID=A0ABQ9VEC2_SAGOE|nr:BTB/POZ domain-containing protein kctd12 [Saguinus oedipus]